MLLKDKVVIVTGASRGVGRALAIGCAREGARVVVNYRSGPGLDVVEEICEAGGQAVPAEGDVAEPWTGKAMVQTAVETFGQVDVLASNAGICPFHSFLDMPVDVMQRTTEVNYFGTFYAAQAAANRMVEQGTGGAIASSVELAPLHRATVLGFTPSRAARARWDSWLCWISRRVAALVVGMKSTGHFTRVRDGRCTIKLWDMVCKWTPAIFPLVR